MISVIIILKQVKPYDSKAYPEFFTSNVASQKSLAAHMLKLRTSGTSMSYFGRTALIGISKAPSCKAKNSRYKFGSWIMNMYKSNKFMCIYVDSCWDQNMWKIKCLQFMVEICDEETFSSIQR